MVLSKRQCGVLQFLGATEGTEASDIAQYLKVKPAAVRNDLRLMEREGLVVRKKTGLGNLNEWFITSEGAVRFIPF